jgi:hypothetical protein
MPHLPPAHHETNKRDSPRDTKIKLKQPNHPRFEFNPRQVNDSSQSNQGTEHLVSQMLIVQPQSQALKVLKHFILALQEENPRVMRIVINDDKNVSLASHGAYLRGTNSVHME